LGNLNHVNPSLDSLSTQIALALMVGNVLLDQIGLPVPAIPTLVLAGAVTADHHWWGLEMFIWSVAACVAADAAWYVAGRRYGNGLMKLLCRISLTPDSCVSETQGRFDRWGPNAIVVAKFVPGLAIIAPPLAGAMRMHWPRFLGLSALAAALWVGIYLGAGALLKPQINQLLPRLAELGGTAAGAIGCLLLAYIGFKWWERRRFLATLRMLRITVAELYQLMTEERAPLIIDIRSHSARARQPSRIPGAVLVQLDQIGVHVRDLPRDRDIVIYCTCPNEASAASAAKALVNHGFKRVRPLHGGLDAWIEAGYAIESLLSVQRDGSKSASMG
jgi:membrane protein DedA with SNARE-associated domain/rhodanese-related sulfurtransferase